MRYEDIYIGMPAKSIHSKASAGYSKGLSGTIISLGSPSYRQGRLRTCSGGDYWINDVDLENDGEPDC